MRLINRFSVFWNMTKYYIYIYICPCEHPRKWTNSQDIHGQPPITCSQYFKQTNYFKWLENYIESEIKWKNTNHIMSTNDKEKALVLKTKRARNYYEFAWIYIQYLDSCMHAP